jgi:hypothetical protein
MMNLIAAAGLNILENVIEQLEPQVTQNILKDLQATSVILSNFVEKYLVNGAKDAKKLD